MNAADYSLVFFDQIDPVKFENEFVLSGLQAFESSLFLMSECRWPSTTLVLWEACEKLLKVATGSEEQRLEAYELQDRFKEVNKGLSSALHDNAHDFRKFRNDIAHKGYSPRDDEKCLQFFFEAGVPYFDCLLKFVFGNDKENLSGDHGQWFWQIYRDTRKVIERKRRKKVGSYHPAILYLKIASRKVFSVGTVVQPLFSSHQKLNLLAESQDLDWEIDQHVRNVVIDRLESAWEYAFEVDSVPCPICASTELLVGIDSGAEDFFLGEAVCLEALCPAYGLPVQDGELLEIFYTAKMSGDDIALLESDDCEPAQKVPV